MHLFKDLGITINATNKSFKGDKIKTERLVNREIAVHDYVIKDSIQEPGKPCLHLQITVGENYHVVFTGSKRLMEQIEQVPKEKFPIKTTIIRDNDWLTFT